MKVLSILTMLAMSLNPAEDKSLFDPSGLMPQLAVDLCKHTKGATTKKKQEALRIAKMLYDVEERLNVPDIMRGMTLSAACLESAFNPSAKGDRKFSANKKTPKAIGVLQMWKWYEKSYGVDRKDPRSAAVGWLTHIKRLLPKVKKQCRYKTQRRLWTAAWVTGIRYKKPGGRCKEKPKHYRFFLKLRSAYDKRTSMSLMKSGT